MTFSDSVRARDPRYVVANWRDTPIVPTLPPQVGAPVVALFDLRNYSVTPSGALALPTNVCVVDYGGESTSKVAMKILTLDPRQQQSLFLH